VGDRWGDRVGWVKPTDGGVAGEAWWVGTHPTLATLAINSSHRCPKYTVFLSNRKNKEPGKRDDDSAD